MNTNITQYIDKPDILKQTAEQIIKDFEMFGIEIKFSGNDSNAYQEIFNQIEPHISKLIENNRQKLMVVINRIDINEQQIKKAKAENPNKDFSVVLSDLIIKRELQKVVIRNHYKK